MDRHVLEALGKTRVVVQDGKVVEVGEPRVDFCPLFHKQKGISKLTKQVVKDNVEFRIADFGMCTPGRLLRMKDFLTFGVSELLGMAVSKGILDSAVIVCEGAGTVILSDPEVIQGVGGRVSGLIETSPIRAVIDRIGANRVLDPVGARIDQFAGVERALDLGHRKIGVTVAQPSDAEKIRRRYGSRVAIFGVHLSGTTARGAEMLFDSCDIVTACASKWVRETASRRALLQVGNKVPIYAASPLGEIILRTRMQELGYDAKQLPDNPPRPLI
jgi:putative methanogenesis marker protein 8